MRSTGHIDAAPMRADVPLPITSFLSLAGRVGILLITYFIVEWWVLGVGQLPASSYAHPSILLAMWKRVFLLHGNAVFGGLKLVTLIAFGYIVVRNRDRLWVPWSSIEGHQYARPFVLVLTAILAWAYSAYDYNLFYDQAHLVDRLLLIGLAGLVVWRPIFVLPFLLTVVSVVWQFKYPAVGTYSVAEQFALVRILMIFGAALLLRGITGKSWTTEFLYLSIVLMGASYLKCGLGKLFMDAETHGFGNWVTHGHIYFLMFATYANGWLAFLDVDSLVTTARRVAPMDLVMVWVTVVLEVGLLFMFWRRWLLQAFLGGWILFHLGVFTVSGICFWKWMMVDGTLLLLFLFVRSARQLPIFTRPYFLLSIPLLVAGLQWFHPVKLAWYDSPASYTYRFVAVSETGARYTLPPRFFAPYDYQFTLGSFHYLSEYPGLHLTWGALWDRDTANALVRAGCSAEVEALEAQKGGVRYDETRATRMERFVRRFVSVFNVRQSKSTALSPIQAPRQLWTFSRPDAFPGGQRITRVVIEQVTSFYDGERYQEFRVRELRSIEIPAHEVLP